MNQRRMRFLIVLVVLVVLVVVLSLGATGLRAAGKAKPTPEQLVSLYFQKLSQNDMTALADYMHSGELAKFRKMMMPVFEAGAEADDGGEMLKAFGQGDTLDQIRAYSPKKFFARFLRWAMVLVPNLEEIMKQATIKPIGHVVEKTKEGDVMHVVVRMTMGVRGMTITRMTVMSLKKDGKEWKLLLTGEMQGIARALRQQSKRKGP